MPAPRRVDWGAARLHWLGQGEPRSFAATARRFGCSQRAVAARAKREEWAVQAGEMDSHSIAVATARLQRSLDLRYADFGHLTDLTVLLTIAGLQEGTIDPKPADAAALMRLQMALDGQATEVIQVSQMRDVLGAWTAAIMPFVPVEQRAEAVAAVRAATAQLQLEPGNEAT